MMEWSYMLDNFKVPYWVRGESTQKSRQRGPIPDLPIVMAAPQHTRPSVISGMTSILDFEHPEECLYWFGGVHELVKKEPENTIAKVYIPMAEMILSPSAGAIFLWDRMRG